MKCPLLSIYDHESRQGKVIKSLDCLKEECAWWDEENSQCCAQTIVSTLEIFNNQLLAIIDKMPHEEQFRK